MLTTFMPPQRLLRGQGIGERAKAVQNKFVKKWAVWLVLVTILALFYVWSRVQVVSLGYEVTSLKQEVEEMSKKVSTLNMEIARLKSPTRLEVVAKNILGLQAPSADQIVLVQPEGGVDGK